MKCLSPEVFLYLNKSSVRPCLEYCWHVWAGARSCYLEILGKRICRTDGPCFSGTLGWSSKCGRYYFRRCSSELAQLVPLPYSRGRSARCCVRLHDFSVNIARCYKDVYFNSFFPRTARPWNSLPPTEFFPLTSDLNGFKSRINRHLLTLGSL